MSPDAKSRARPSQRRSNACAPTSTRCARNSRKTRRPSSTPPRRSRSRSSLRRTLDRTVLEVGLGGRLDSTNAVAPAITCITSIELEHTDKLGSTHAEIAAEKAGILKAGVPLVLGPVGAEGRGGDSRSGPRPRSSRDATGPGLRGGSSRRESRRPRPHLHGRRGLDRGPASTARRLTSSERRLAIAILRRLGVCRASGSFASAVSRGFAGAVLPARAELLGRRPWILVDGAHTAASAVELAGVLRSCPAEASIWCYRCPPTKTSPRS